MVEKKKSTSEKILAGVLAGGMLWVTSFSIAFLVMVLEGAVADNFGWPTFGYMTWYFAVTLLSLLGSVVFRGLLQTLIFLFDKN